MHDAAVHASVDISGVRPASQQPEVGHNAKWVRLHANARLRSAWRFWWEQIWIIIIILKWLTFHFGIRMLDARCIDDVAPRPKPLECRSNYCTQIFTYLWQINVISHGDGKCPPLTWKMYVLRPHRPTFVRIQSGRFLSKRSHPLETADTRFDAHWICE